MELLKEVYERRKKEILAGEAIEAEIYLYGSVVEGKKLKAERHRHSRCFG